MVFGALTERGDQLRGLIENSNDVFATTAARDQRAAGDASSRCRPSSASRPQTLKRLTSSPRTPTRSSRSCGPAAKELSPTLEDLSALAPDLKALFRDFDKLITASSTGFPAAETILEDLRPLLNQADPALRQVIPILEGLGAYKGELTAFFANTAAATQAFDPGHAPALPAHDEPAQRREPRRRIRAASAPTARTRTSCRAATTKLASGLEVYENRHCGRARADDRHRPRPRRRCRPVVPDLPVPVLAVPCARPSCRPRSRRLTQSLIDRINQYAFPAGNAAPAPACKKQGKFPVGGETTRLPAPQGNRPLASAE